MKRRKDEQLESIEFDPNARQEYLTGFHKRKVARKKQAQEVAVKKEREERIQQRKEIREQRKADIEQHVEEVNAILKKQRRAADDDAESGSDEEWAGFDEAPTVPIIDKTDEYIDEDKYATVTVKEMNHVREMIDSSEDEGGGAKKYVEQAEPDAKQKNKRKRADGNDRVKKKRSFRYETKTERQATRHKNSARNAKAAKARREA